MSIASLMETETVAIIKATGQRIDNVKASVQTERIFISRSDILIEPNDFVLWSAPNGAEYTYQVIDPCFFPAFHGIEAGYQMKVKKLGLPEAKQAIQKITNHFHGDNVKVNIDSIDNSINIIQTSLKAELNKLSNEIEKLSISIEEKKQAKDILTAITQLSEQKNPNKTAIQALLNQLPNASNIASIGSFVLDLLK